MAITVTHPLDPLTADELAAAVAILRESPDVGEVRFVDVALEEPSKAALAAWRDGGERPPRVARASLLDPVAGRALEARVDVDAGGLAGLRVVPDVQPAIHPEEFVAGGGPCARPGVPGGARAAGAGAGRGAHRAVVVRRPGAGRAPRCARHLVAARRRPNPYAHPIGGLVALVDLNAMQVVRVDDYGVVPIPGRRRLPSPRCRAAAQASSRSHHAARGPSFDVEAACALAELGFPGRLHPARGLGAAPGRLAAGRAAASDPLPRLLLRDGRAVRRPVADPLKKNAFDVGEYNIGLLANSLELGCDCLGEIRYFDVELADNRGNPYTLKNAICMHEEDDGLLWKHTDFRTGAVGDTAVARLVVSCSGRSATTSTATIGSSGRTARWSSRSLTGVLTTGCWRGVTPQYATREHGRPVCAVHQHFFNFRLDMDVTAPPTRSTRCTRRPSRRARTTRSATSSTPRRRCSAPSRRRSNRWTRCADASGRSSVRNAQQRRRRADRLPPDAAHQRRALRAARGQLAQRAGFMAQHLWVTPYAPDELFAAGDYPNQHSGGDGLPRWTAANRSIESTDVVLWYRSARTTRCGSRTGR